MHCADLEGTLPELNVVEDDARHPRIGVNRMKSHGAHGTVVACLEFRTLPPLWLASIIFYFSPYSALPSSVEVSRCVSYSFLNIPRVLFREEKEILSA